MIFKYTIDDEQIAIDMSKVERADYCELESHCTIYFDSGEFLEIKSAELSKLVFKAFIGGDNGSKT